MLVGYNENWFDLMQISQTLCCYAICKVVVEYGADLHTFDHGSGFPTRSNTDDPDDEVGSPQ